MSDLTHAIREAIEASGQSRYRIAQETGIAQSQLSRLVNGERGMTVETIERLARHLELEIVVRPKGKGKGKGG